MKNVFLDMNHYFYSIPNSLNETTKQLNRLCQMFQRPIALSMRTDKKVHGTEKILNDTLNGAIHTKITFAKHIEHIFF